MKLLDLFCGAGGCSEGYRRAGWTVTGVDLHPQPHHRGGVFVQADALEFCREHGHEFDAIHASPPCHAYSTVTTRWAKNLRTYPDLVPATRAALAATGKPYVIENVVGAPLLDHIRLCGSSFGLDVRRHRLFESNVALGVPPPCRHESQLPRFRSLDSRMKGLSSVVGVHGHLNYPGEFELRQKAMGIDWMPNKELTQAIPPVYTEWIGVRLAACVLLGRLG